MGSGSEGSAEGLRIRIDGSVQGVGFRPWVYSLAHQSSLRGRVWNEAGSVQIEAFGPRPLLFEFLDSLRQPPMRAAAIRQLHWESIRDQPPSTFDIVASHGGRDRRPAIPPDLAVCDACREEMNDPADRRYRYAFINCTQCGPRYSICRDVPYDRDHTTMDAFEMCGACRAEYENPLDRRFHAQPVACPLCGPTLLLVDAAGRVLEADSGAIDRAAALLQRGNIVAVKGLGGFHLACDATSQEVVGRLRARKQRDAKPFAIMVRDLDQAERFVTLDREECALLDSPARPIVLVARRDPSSSRSARTLAAALAPNNPMVGVMLPYTPLHEMLLEAVGQPLVMTSGNRSDEPMATTDREASEHLAGAIADALLLHDRAIANRCDDSVTRVLQGEAVVLRRGRGWVPASLTLSSPTATSLLACGAHLKNTFCYAESDRAWLGPHVGDLETHEACLDYEAMVERFGRFVGITPQAVACDLHPDYFSTRWASEYASRHELPLVRVQHHHAHVAAAMVEHGLPGPVLGLAWDGTGDGGDGTAWGGELLLANYAGFRRLATFRPIPLAGGERAIREVWRIALAVLDDAFDGRPPLGELALFEQIEADQVRLVHDMIDRRLRCPSAHGVGRWFDALGALALALPQSRFEGEVAMRLGFAAEAFRGDGELPPAYSFDVDDSGACAFIDLRPTVRAAVGDLLDGRNAGLVSARFHATLIAAASGALRAFRRQLGDLPVVLTGGCFQNALLLGGIRAEVGRDAHVFTHRQVPPNDGGIALGQAAIAAAVLNGEPGFAPALGVANEGES